MKPNEKQIAVINSVISIIRTWKNTNDINSPTHFSDIDEFINSDLLEVIAEDSIDEIGQSLTNILWEIKKITYETI